MNKSLRKSYKLLILMNNLVIDLPAPLNLSVLWNGGSILGLFLFVQIVSGLVLSMHYTSDINMAFMSINHIMRDVNSGWLIRNIHSNGASFFFVTMYFHIGRGLYYGSYSLIWTWYIGVIIFLLSMMTAFLGYVLPWGQMSFWGATVITNLLSAIPYIGDMTVKWIWGGFSVGNATLSRFFSIHFILPFILLSLVMLHLLFLHETGSSNPIGVNSNIDKIPFHPYYVSKDFMGFFVSVMFFMFTVLYFPIFFSDPDNFLPANSMVTPIHIQPEWYFLFAYAILRTIPNKLGGVIGLVFSILILFILPFSKFSKFKGFWFYPLSQVYFWLFVSNFFLLTWIGSQPVEDPFFFTGMLLTNFYFMYFVIDSFLLKFWDYLIN